MKKLITLFASSSLSGAAFGQDVNVTLVNTGVQVLVSIFEKCFGLGVIVVVALIAKYYLTKGADDDVPKYRYRGKAKRFHDRHEYIRGSYLRSDYRHRDDEEE